MRNTKTYFIFTPENPQFETKDMGAGFYIWQNMKPNSLAMGTGSFAGKSEMCFIIESSGEDVNALRENIYNYCIARGQHSALEVKDGRAYLIEPNRGEGTKETYLGRWEAVSENDAQGVDHSFINGRHYAVAA